MTGGGGGKEIKKTMRQRGQERNHPKGPSLPGGAPYTLMMASSMCVFVCLHKKNAFNEMEVQSGETLSGLTLLRQSHIKSVHIGHDTHTHVRAVRLEKLGC